MTPSVSIRTGNMRAYHALAHLHYLAGPPATRARILVATTPAEPDPIGVLVVSMPALNARWRDAAFEPDGGTRPRYRTGDARADARRLNRDLRTISRVIVDPRYRALGIATALVRAYLDQPLTPATEAVAAMGTFSGFFARAGMVRCAAAPAPDDQRLADALHAVGIAPWLLADPARIPDRELHHPLLRRELRRWAHRSCTTRALLDAGTIVMLRHAARVVFPPTVYAHVATHQHRGAA